MGLLDAVFGDGSKELLKVLELLPHGNAKTRESDFRDLAHRFLLELGDIEVKREAGVQAKGTRIDLYAHYRSIDYLITIKKGLSEQKVKNIIGECSVLGGPALVHDEERERAHPRRLAVGFADRGLAQLAADADADGVGNEHPLLDARLVERELDRERTSRHAAPDQTRALLPGLLALLGQVLGERDRRADRVGRLSGREEHREAHRRREEVPLLRLRLGAGRLVVVLVVAGRRLVVGVGILGVAGGGGGEEAGEIPLRRRDREDLSRGRGVERPDEVGLERGHEVLTDVGRGGHQQ